MVQFAAPAEHYDRFMGRYVPRLAVALADAAGVAEGMRALDVGCGPGGLTHELVGRLGADHVAAIDPSPQFAAANRERHPGVDVRDGAAESLPFDGGMTMLSTFWRAVRTVEPGAQGEQARVGVREGDIAEVLARAGLDDVEDGTLLTGAHYEGFDDFWTPFTYAVGPAGSYLATLTAEQQGAIREECRRLLGEPDGPFDLEARAWYARGVVPG